MQYRSLTPEEIDLLEKNSCWAEDWTRVKVAEEDFQAKFFHRVMFYGDIRLGKCQKDIEIAKDFVKCRKKRDIWCCCFNKYTPHE